MGCSSPALSFPQPKARASKWAALLLFYLLLILKQQLDSGLLHLLLYILPNLKLELVTELLSSAISAPQPKARASQWASLLLFYLLLNLKQELVSGLLFSCSIASSTTDYI